MVWHLDVRIKGQRVIKSLKTLDQQEAWERARQLYPELAEKTQPLGEATLSDLHRRVTKHKALDRADNTLTNYNSSFKSFMGVLGDREVKKVTAEDVERWRIECGLKPSSINAYVNCLQEAFKVAVRWHLTRKNPFAGVERLRLREPSRIRYFTDDQVNLLLTVPKPHYYVVVLGFRAGLRVTECIRLERQHIESDYIRIDQPTKSRKYRRIPISKKLRVELADFEPIGLDRHNAHRYLFRFGERHGFHVTPHMLRHTFSARKLSAGVPLLTVARWLGHSSVVVTERSYGHLVPGSQDHLIDLGDE